jgi:putative ABC transport system permease protein
MTTPGPEPPRLAQLILTLLLPARYRDQQVGDLLEEYRSRRSQGLPAGAWYWRQALRSIGPNTALRARNPRHHQPSKSTRMETLLQDLRYGLRTMMRSPGFAVVSTITLALAIGVNTAIFSLVNVIVFADLPMDDPGRVVILRAANQRLGVEYGGSTLREYLDYRDDTQSFAELAAWRGRQWILTGDEEPLRVQGFSVTPNFLQAWGIGTVLGRSFAPDDAQPGAPAVAILSHGFWMRQFGARPDMVGSTIRLDGTERTVVGVMTPDMEYASLRETEIWIPMTLDRADDALDLRTLSLTGRLEPGATAEHAASEIAILSGGIAEQNPTLYRGWETRVLYAKDSLVNADGKRILLLLTLTVTFVLLIACANVANMLLARATARSREVAVRRALGAHRIRLVRQLLTESFVIGIVASAVGLGLSRALMQSLIWITDGQEVAFQMATVDTNVLLFTLMITLVTPLAFGLLPALRSSGLDVSSALREGSLRAGGRKGNRTRGLLVGSQVTLALMLMVVAGLLTRSVVNMQQRDLGIETSNTLTMRIRIPESKYGDDQARRQFFHQVIERTRGLSGVERVALSRTRPFMEMASIRSFDIEGQVVEQEMDRPSSRAYTVSPGFRALMGIPLISGRDLTAQDNDQSYEAALVSQEVARRFWGGQDPIGQRFKLVSNRDMPWVQVVGVVGDLASNDPQDERPQPAIYLPFDQNVSANMALLVRTRGDPLTLAGPVREQVWALDSDQPVDDVKTIEQGLHDNNLTNVALIMLFVTFAVFALAMSAVGIYGVMSYSVSQRAGEISIRMALGARSGNVRLMVMGQGGKLLLLGGAAGLLGAVGMSRLLTSLVVGISPLDPLTFVGVPAVLLAIGFIANYLPARRATKIDPMKALRVE